MNRFDQILSIANIVLQVVTAVRQQMVAAEPAPKKTKKAKSPKNTDVAAE